MVEGGAGVSHTRVKQTFKFFVCGMLYGVCIMAMVRTTLVLDDFLVQLVRQRFNGNVSSGVNQVLKEHLLEEKKESFFGRGKHLTGLLDNWEKEEEEDERAVDKVHDLAFFKGKKKGKSA